MAPTVLVVDDQPRIRELYATWLEVDHEVRTAADGAAALEAVDDAVDVVLLDRRMPGLHGDEVLSTVRARGHDVRVVMVTAVDPEVEVVDMPFDDYLVKPVSRADLEAAVAAVLARDAYDDRVEEYFEVVAKLGLLEANLPRETLADHEAYASLRERRRRLRRELDDTVERLRERGTYRDLFVELPDPEAGPGFAERDPGEG